MRPGWLNLTMVNFYHQKIAPDNTAPATNAGEKPIAVPTPISATPTVASVVKADPIIDPTIAVTNKALGKNHAALATLNPNHSIVGMTFVPIHRAINIPISKNKNNGANAVFEYWVLGGRPKVARRSLAKIIVANKLISNGTYGDNPRPIMLPPKIITNKITRINACPNRGVSVFHRPISFNSLPSVLLVAISVDNELTRRRQ